VKRRNPQAGLTLMEVMIASTIMVIMMALAWRTISNTSDARRNFGKYQERNHEIRMALGRVVADFEAAYLSQNEERPDLTNPRTMMIVKSGSKVPEIRFSTLGHRVLWSDANESEQTVISYLPLASRETPGTVDWVRAERRRPSNKPVEEEPAEYDVLVRNIEKVEIELWNYKTLEWLDTWDTTQSDGQKDMLPSRARITVTVKNAEGKDLKISTQARVYMQEPLLFNPKTR
jgi:general secretion pathway protein J